MVGILIAPCAVPIAESFGLTVSLIQELHGMGFMLFSSSISSPFAFSEMRCANASAGLMTEMACQLRLRTNTEWSWIRPVLCRVIFFFIAIQWIIFLK